MITLFVHYLNCNYQINRTLNDQLLHKEEYKCDMTSLLTVSLMYFYVYAIKLFCYMEKQQCTFHLTTNYVNTRNNLFNYIYD